MKNVKEGFLRTQYFEGNDDLDFMEDKCSNDLLNGGGHGCPIHTQSKEMSNWTNLQLRVCTVL